MALGDLDNLERALVQARGLLGRLSLERAAARDGRADSDPIVDGVFNVNFGS